MAINVYELISLGIYFALMLAIGLYAFRTSTSDTTEYMLGGRKLHPAVGALSAGASDMSGWLLMGLPGAIYFSGLGSAWIAVGLTIGAYLNYRFVAARLRIYTELADDSITLPDFFENRFKDGSHLLRIISAVVIILFFTVYTSAGIVAGGKLFVESFGLSYVLGLFITAGVVLAYTVVGGFLAVSLTDFVQGVIMFLALIIVPVACFMLFGNSEALIQAVASAPPATDGAPDRSGFFNWTDGMTFLGFCSLMAWGFGYFGQPHIIVRFMAVRSAKDMPATRYIGMGWMLVAVIGSVLVGVTGVGYVNVHGLQSELVDNETIFILLSQTLFHPLISGFLLAAILAAIMSTISSQLLVTSSSLTEDIYKTLIGQDASEAKLVTIGRIATIVVCALAIALAWNPNSSILGLVANAWAGFGAAFGPLILLSLYWRRYTCMGAMTSMLVGAFTVIGWTYLPIMIDDQHISSWLYSMIPGVFFAAVSGVIVSLMGKTPSDEIQAEFSEMEQQSVDARGNGIGAIL